MKIKLLSAYLVALAVPSTVAGQNSEKEWEPIPDVLQQMMEDDARLTAEVTRLEYNATEAEQTKLRSILIDRIRPLWDWNNCMGFYSERYSASDLPADTAADAALGKCQQYARLVAIQEAAASRYAPYIYEETRADRVYNSYLIDGRRTALSIIAEKRTEP